MNRVVSMPSKDNMSLLSVRKIGVFLGAEVAGVDLSKPLSEEIADAITHAHAEHQVLVFPDQVISSEDLMRFGRYFGDLTVHPFSTSAAETPELIVYDNKEGNPPAPTDVWHTDETFREEPPMGTVLCSKIIPEYGGNTAFASMTAIYEGLSDRLQQFLSGLEAVHDLGPFKGLFPDTEEGRKRMHAAEERYPPVTHPVVRVHPITGKKALFVNPQFTLYIKGMEEEESTAILQLLYKKTLRHEYHYRHQWQPNMVVFWDNRSAQHSALHDYYPQQRKMERVTISGDKPIGDAKPADPSELRHYLMPPVMSFDKTRQKRQHENEV